MEIDIKKQILIYKKELKENKHSEFFNIYAFLFGPFYFCYTGMGLYFVTFTFLPLLIMLPIYLFTDYPHFGQLGVVISQLIAGFVTNPAYIRHKKRFIKTYEHVDITKPVEYFPISILRLYLCTLLSAGLYLMYWGYRNWNAYKKTTRDAVNPWVRSLIIPLTAEPLFERMDITVKQNQNVEYYYYLDLITLFIGIYGLNYPCNENWVVYLRLIGLAAILLYPVFYFSAQKKVNQYTVEKLGKPLNKKFDPAEIFVILLGLYINFLLLSD